MSKKALLVAPGDVYATILNGSYAALGFSGFNVERVNSKLIEKGWTTFSLPDRAATKENTLKFFDQTISNQPDEVLFYFCGHADLSFDTSLDETIDDSDEYLILYDSILEFHTSSASAQEFSLLDNELTKIVSNHLARAIPITVVLDCCHGAGLIDKMAQFVGNELPFNFFASSAEDALSFARSDTSFFTEALLMASNECHRLGDLKEKTKQNLEMLFPDQQCVIQLNNNNDSNFL